MKKIKLVASVLIVAGILTASAVSFAEDPFTSTSKNISTQIQANNKLENYAIVDVGGEKITNVDLLNYKAYKNIESIQISDEELLEEMITELLYKQLAKERNVAASLEDGRKMAEENRQILAQQSKEVQEVQEKMIEAMGLTEDQYWNDFAPAEYQKIITAQNLSALLVEENTLQYNVDDLNDYGQKLKQFKHQLYEQNKSGKVKLLDTNVSLK